MWGDEGGGGGGGNGGVGRGGKWALRAVERRWQRGAGVEEAIKLEEELTLRLHGRVCVCACVRARARACV